MMSTVFVKNYGKVQLRRREILRYMGCTNETDEIKKLINNCLLEAEDVFAGKVCYAYFPVSKEDDKLNLSFMKTESSDLKKNLENCSRIILFAATAGLGIDRLTVKYSKVAPSKALCFQSIGAEMIESLCDNFCSDMKKEWKIKPRFSPGYGDFPLWAQREIFSVLSCEKNMGLTLNDSLLVSPTKSVTAIIGIEEKL